MRRNSMIRVGLFAAGIMTWSAAGRLVDSVAAENGPAVDPRITELHVRLCGTKA
jgi:hypothetical protein